ncbi:MAG: M48 family metalloprotease [Phycisphaeraceae bacterium]|nr:M48 family metalloprotease [Phycisphaeraceae bacterium]MCW5762013.1 M48 family metalloprotease [Phycisphaeraceae bacterium]
MNSVKTAILLGALMGVFVAVGGMLGREFLWPALFFGVIVNSIAFFFSDTIAIKAMRGRELTPETGGDVYRMVDRLRQQADLPMPRVYLCPHQAPNAFATGRSPKKAAVAFTQGALDLLSPMELEGVAAHELAHIKNRDTLTSTIAATIAGTLAFVAQWGFLLMSGRREGVNPLVSIVVLIIAAVGAALIQAMISRTREYAADAEGAAIAGSPNGLMSALTKLESYSKRVPLVQPNPAQNNLFIVEPFTGSKGLTSMFATHPPTAKRLAALAKLR